MIYILYVYLGIGLIYAVLTLRDTLEEINQRYPHMRAEGYTKFKKFMLVWFKSSAYGIATVIHFAVMTPLYPIDMISKKGNKR